MAKRSLMTKERTNFAGFVAGRSPCNSLSAVATKSSLERPMCWCAPLKTSDKYEGEECVAGRLSSENIRVLLNSHWLVVSRKAANSRSVTERSNQRFMEIIGAGRNARILVKKESDRKRSGGRRLVNLFHGAALRTACA